MSTEGDRERELVRYRGMKDRGREREGGRNETGR